MPLKLLAAALTLSEVSRLVQSRSMLSLTRRDDSIVDVNSASSLSSLSSLETGSIPYPTPAQLRYQSTDFVALIHFNMGTFAHNGDPCCDPTNWDVLAPYATGKTVDPATFDPKLLNTTQWFESINALGANIAILTAKHGCGFGLWPTKAQMPDGTPYGYSVGTKASAPGLVSDVLHEFVDSANAAGVGYGFYYSIAKNFFLCRSFSGSNSCMETVLPGQHNVTDEQYGAIVKTMVTELWTEYGNLTEIWVDSGLEGFGDLMTQLQPQAVGTPDNPTGWCGTESGHPSKDVGPGDIWSTGSGFFGSPDATNWLPKFCDPQLFQEHVWFWEPNLQVRTLEMLIPIYHDIVGRGMTMELAFSIDRDGLVQDTHAAMYKALGDWVRACYGTPLAMATNGQAIVDIHVAAGQQFDRYQITEELVLGQRIRNFTVSTSTDGKTFTKIGSGGSVGKKRITLLDTPVTAPASGLTVRLQSTEYSATPQVSFFGVFAPCATK